MPVYPILTQGVGDYSSVNLLPTLGFGGRRFGKALTFDVTADYTLTNTVDFANTLSFSVTGGYSVSVGGVYARAITYDTTAAYSLYNQVTPFSGTFKDRNTTAVTSATVDAAATYSKGRGVGASTTYTAPTTVTYVKGRNSD